jgi:hypothetical protein
MLNKALLGKLNKVLVGAGVGLCMAACASAPTQSPAATAAVKADPACTVYTGSSRILPTQCAAIGNSYNQTDIRTTGATDAHQALLKLDPAITSGAGAASSQAH